MALVGCLASSVVPVSLCPSPARLMQRRLKGKPREISQSSGVFFFSLSSCDGKRSLAPCALCSLRWPLWPLRRRNNDEAGRGTV